VEIEQTKTDFNSTDESTNATDLLLGAIRTEALRARLACNELDRIGLALRCRMISNTVAVEWLRELGIGRIIGVST
jgi:hypothetical protein